MCQPANPSQVDQTTLYLPKTLREVYGNAEAWAFVGGFIG